MLARATPMRTCDHCGHWFGLKRRTGRFCSTECRSAVFRLEREEARHGIRHRHEYPDNKPLEAGVISRFIPSSIQLRWSPNCSRAASRFRNGRCAKKPGDLAASARSAGRWYSCLNTSTQYSGIVRHGSHAQRKLLPKGRTSNWYFYLYDDGGKRRTVCTGTADRKEAEQIRAVKQDEQRHAALFGPQEILTFGAACGYYLKADKNNHFLMLLFKLWGKTLVKNITAGVIKQAAIDLYPGAEPATWIRQVVTPALAVINHCAELGRCAPLRVKRLEGLPGR